MRRMRTVGLVTAVVTVAAPAAMAMTAAIALPSSAIAAASRPAISHAATHGDFDGDGKQDLVVGAPGHVRVRVTYTSATPGGSHSQWIAKPDPNAFGFGSALAVGDFNGDGFADLAVGALGYVSAESSAEQGAVFIYDGSPTGLHYSGTVFKGPDNPDDDNEFGAALAAGNVNGDSFADLAVGNPGPEGGGDGMGSVAVIFGSATGLTSAGELHFGSPNPVEEGNFGASVVLADVNGDGHPDLVAGEPGGGPALTSGFVHAGDIQVLFGDAAGIGSTHEMLTGAQVGASGSLGSSLAEGNITHDRFADVVAGAPAATVAGKSEAGRVVLLTGGTQGLTASHRTVFSEASPGVPTAPLIGDAFGSAVAVGDLTGDGRAEIIVGAAGAHVGTLKRSGAVYVFRGTKAGATSAHCQRLTQATTGVPGAPAAGADLGAAVATRVVAGARSRVLLIGVPNKHAGGLVLELPGGSSGINPLHTSVIKDPQVGDGFGSAFAA
jgi:hypothetical protein